MAIKLGFSIGSAEGSATTKVLVADWVRSAECVAADKKTRLLYGQVVRVLMSVSGITASGNLTLPVIAAHATLNRQSSSVEADVKGLTDIDLLKLANSLGGPLTVETFEKNNAIILKLRDMALSTSATGAPVPIGVVTGRRNLAEYPASAFALQQLANGKSCIDGKAKLPSDPIHGTAFDAVYVEVAGSCDATAPKPVARAMAMEALAGYKVAR